MQSKTFSTEIGGKELIAEFTDLANQAHGSVILRYGNTVVLATVVMSDRKREDIDYFPLTVDYEEKFYAAGKILGSRFMRREGRPSDGAILSGRVVDRTIRPLFDHNIRNEVQMIVTILSIDEDDPDILAVNAASLALATSDIPWEGPISAVRIGKTNENENLITNPTYKSRESGVSVLDLLVCGKEGTINMIEVGANEVSEEELSRGFEEGLKEIEKLQVFQEKIVKEIGKEKREIKVAAISDAIKESFEKHVAPELLDMVFVSGGKSSPYKLRDNWIEKLSEEIPEESAARALAYFEEKVDELIHKEALENGKRADGRSFDEIRTLFVKAGGISPVLHGSGIFYRGGTHVFSALTLGGPRDSLLIDSIEGQDVQKRFIHHYNFPPFSVGETGRVGGMNRRMIGHGALAEKALEAVIPEKEEFPYTIRLVSEAMASNGSTSMGSVCASTLALLDGGVPIKRPVAGIAMGLIMEPFEKASLDKTRDNASRYKILTDIQGPEDHYGDMDLKVAGTREGITAVQMDVKIGGVPVKILSEALAGAKKARFQILDLIAGELPKSRPDISPAAPKIITLKVKEDQIGTVIGPGGKTINKIKDTTGVDEINIEDDGSVYITGSKETAEDAAQQISDLTRTYEAGEHFEGEVTRITTFGAFVKLNGSAEGLVHVSEIAPFRIGRVEDVLSVGEHVPVVIKEVDEQGRINLSIKQIAPDFAEKKGVKPVSNNQNINNQHKRG